MKCIVSFVFLLSFYPIHSVHAALSGTIPLPDRKPPAGFENRRAAIAAMARKEVVLIEQPEALPPGVRELKNLQYTRIGDRSLELDLYLPETMDPDKPTLIFIHGGSWSGGSRDAYHYYTILFAKKGFATATISYRLSGEAPYPAAVEDIKCAVRWLRAHAQKYGLNPDRFVALGGSAGGHLSLMLAYSSEVEALEGNGGHNEFSSAIQAVVNFYGPVDLTTKQGQESGSVRAFLGGKSFDKAPSLYRDASPISHLSKEAPPTLTIHGTLDDAVNIRQADILENRLKSLGVPYAYVRLEGWTHMFDLVRDVNDYCVVMVESFLKQIFPPIE